MQKICYTTTYFVSAAMLFFGSDEGLGCDDAQMKVRRKFLDTEGKMLQIRNGGGFGGGVCIYKFIWCEANLLLKT